MHGTSVALSEASGAKSCLPKHAAESVEHHETYPKLGTY